MVMRFFFSRILSVLLLCGACSLSAMAQSGNAEKIRHYLAQSRRFQQAQPDSAVFYADRAVQLAEAENDQPALGELMLQLGEINAAHGHHDLARRFFNEALGIFRRLHETAGIARTYDALGVLEGDSTDFGRAMQYYRDSRDSAGISTTYTAMGQAAEKKGATEKALSFYLRALAQYEHRRHYPEAYFSLLQAIGELYAQKGDLQTAQSYFREGIRDSVAQGTPDAAARLLNAEGAALEKQKDNKDALISYKQALADARRYRQPDQQAEALLGIAGILKQSDAKGSIADLKQALAIARGLNQPELQARIYAALAGVYRQQKDYGEAMAALDEQRHLVDSLLSADTVKDINALDSSYALESAQDKVGYLQRVNQLEGWLLWGGLGVVVLILALLILLWRYLKKTRQLNTELTHSNRVKDTLFSVVGHDLKGPAGSAAQLFELMDTEELPPEEMKVMVHELRKQTAASLELLQSLFEWGKAQLQGVQVHPVDFDPAPVIERSIHLLGQQAVLKGIRIESELPACLRLHADTNHFEFIIRNLVSNAVKFSFEGGLITIRAEALPQQQEVVFAVRDEGTGIAPEQQAVFLTGNLKVNFGTQKEKGSGLGLLLTKDFVKANGGRIWLESEPGKGSTFYVAVPAAA